MFVMQMMQVQEEKVIGYYVDLKQCQSDQRRGQRQKAEVGRVCLRSCKVNILENADVKYGQVN